MYLIFDTSALKKPFSYKAPVTDTFSWPRMIHISWITLGEDLKPIKDFNCIIKPTEYTLTEEACEHHGIEMETAQEGDDLVEVLQNFAESIAESQYIFSHNLKYNESIVGAEFVRKKISHRLFQAEKYCIMQEGTYYCKLRGKRGGYKWPSLQEMHAVLFKQKYAPANNARADVIAAARCFIKLKTVRALEDIFIDD